MKHLHHPDDVEDLLRTYSAAPAAEARPEPQPPTVRSSRCWRCGLAIALVRWSGVSTQCEPDLRHGYLAHQAPAHLSGAPVQLHRVDGAPVHARLDPTGPVEGYLPHRCPVQGGR